MTQHPTLGPCACLVAAVGPLTVRAAAPVPSLGQDGSAQAQAPARAQSSCVRTRGLGLGPFWHDACVHLILMMHACCRT